MKGVGWEAEGCLNITQAKKAGQLLSDVSEVLRLIVSVSKSVHRIGLLFVLRLITARKRTASGSPR